MNDYSAFIFPDKLVSPINNYSCKRITKQNIEQFWFTSVENLWAKYPKFSLVCNATENSRRTNLKIASNKSQSIAKARRIQEYNLSPTICATCKTAMPYEKRHNKYCSSSCAAKTFNSLRSKESREKQKNSIKTFYKTKIKTFICKKCGEEFQTEQNKFRKYCSSKCRLFPLIKKKHKIIKENSIYDLSIFVSKKKTAVIKFCKIALSLPEDHQITLDELEKVKGIVQQHLDSGLTPKEIQHIYQIKHSEFGMFYLVYVLNFFWS